MPPSNALYQPSILELARAGNCRALTYWFNSFLGPQGISVQVLPAADQFLKILVYFRRPKQKAACLRLREQLARFICYRLWTLNSDAIRGVQIVARLADAPRVLWQVSVRINSPAAVKRRQAEKTAQLRTQSAKQLKFRVYRSLFMSSITLAGFLLGFWLFSLEISRAWTKNKSTDATALTDQANAATAVSQTQPASPRLPAPPGYTNFTVPDSFKGQVLAQVDLADDQKVIALTFDDGPSEGTEQVLDILKQYNVQATFFMSGVNVKRSPELARQVVAAGHAIGNRGWNHSLGNSSSIDPSHEIGDTAKLLHEVTGARTALYRPADGQLNNQLVSYAQQQQYAIALWSVDSQDVLVAAPLVLDNVLRNVRPGRIILMHDGQGGRQAATVQVLPQLIMALKQQGYRFVTVSDLLTMPSHVQGGNHEPTLPLRKRAVAMTSVDATDPNS
jgi:chitin deacetylase